MSGISAWGYQPYQPLDPADTAPADLDKIEAQPYLGSRDVEKDERRDAIMSVTPEDKRRWVGLRTTFHRLIGKETEAVKAQEAPAFRIEGTQDNAKFQLDVAPSEDWGPGSRMRMKLALHEERTDATGNVARSGAIHYFTPDGSVDRASLPTYLLDLPQMELMARRARQAVGRALADPAVPDRDATVKELTSAMKLVSALEAGVDELNALVRKSPEAAFAVAAYADVERTYEAGDGARTRVKTKEIMDKVPLVLDSLKNRRGLTDEERSTIRQALVWLNTHAGLRTPPP